MQSDVADARTDASGLPDAMPDTGPPEGALPEPSLWDVKRNVKDLAGAQNAALVVTGNSFGEFPGDTEEGSLYVAKYDASHELVWLTTFVADSGNRDEPRTVATAESGAIYVGGVAFNKLEGEENDGERSGFLAKLNASGEKQWLKIFANGRHTAVEDIVVGPSGDVHVVGSTRGSVWDTRWYGARDAIVAKFDKTGKRLWAKSFGNRKDSYAYGASVDGSGNLYVGGMLDDRPGDGKTGTGKAWLRKLDSEGNKKWEKTITNKRGFGVDHKILDVRVGPNGAIYAVGSGSGPDVAGKSIKGGSDIFLTRYDASGDRKWLRMIRSAGLDYDPDLAVAGPEYVYVSGKAYGTFGSYGTGGQEDYFLARYAPSGKRVDIRTVGPSGISRSGAVAATSDGNLHLAGDASSSDEPGIEFNDFVATFELEQ